MIFTRGLGSLFILLVLVTTVQAKHLGTFGATYSIVERDALEEIRDKARTTDWERAFNREMWEKKLKAYRPSALKALPRAERENVFTVDLTYTLDFDIPDGKGGVLYPKGYTFNPLDYVSFPNTLIFIDGSDPIQVGWLESSEYSTDGSAMILITDGSYYDLFTRLKRPVFYADARIVERFRLSAVPAVVHQRENLFEVREIAILSTSK